MCFLASLGITKQFGMTFRLSLEVVFCYCGFFVILSDSEASLSHDGIKRHGTKALSRREFFHYSLVFC